MLGAGWGWGEVPPLDPASEIWGTNNVMYARYSGDFNQWTRWFDLHPKEHILRRRPQAYEWYTRQDGSRPIYLKEADPDVPGSVAFPFEAVRQRFCTETHDERDFWGSLSWMLAFAIVEGFQQIDLLWFALMNDQYTKQVPSTRYWIGQARGRGLRCTVHGTSMLNPQGLMYGCEALSPPLPEESAVAV